MARESVIGNIVNTVEKKGWACIGVFPTVACPGQPFNYTVGLTDMGHAELIICGVPNRIGHDILCGMVEQIKDGAKFLDGEMHELVRHVDTDQPMMCRIRKNSGAKTYAARLLYGDEMEVLQVVLPDSEGKLPGEEGTNEAWAETQEFVV